jgi:hypothetical protein
MVLEIATGIPVRVGQGHPQLDTVEDRGVRGGHLRVRDAVAASHQIELSGADERMGAEAVTVLDRAAEEPAHRLQPCVRMRRQVHAARSDLDRSVVVGEAPGADQRPGPLRNRAPHLQCPRSAQWHVARREHLDPGGAFGPCPAAHRFRDRF